MALSVYEEHIDEASFLYSQRADLLNNSGIAWTDIDDFEQRMEAHVDALALGGNLALDVCIQRLASDEPGDLFTVMCVFCRQGAEDQVMESIEATEPQDEERLRAITDALRYELPDQWGDELIRSVVEKRPNAALVLARAAGYRRLPAGAGRELLKMLPGGTSQLTCEILDSLGRLRHREASALLLDQYLVSDDESIRAHAAKALLMLGEQQALQYCLQSVSSQDWPDTLLGISAGRSAATLLMKKSMQEKMNDDTLLALGLLGDLSAVGILLGCLDKPETLENAVLALNLITGAEIYEDVFIPDEIHEDELSAEELEKFHRGQPPARPDGTPYGINITRLSRKPDDWRRWWSSNGSQFKEGIRYRNGKPFTPACLLENIEHEKSHFKIRQLACQELASRYGVIQTFETNMFVIQQRRIIPDIARWVAANSTHFQSGKWYFAGQPVS